MKFIYNLLRFVVVVMYTSLFQIGILVPTFLEMEADGPVVVRVGCFVVGKLHKHTIRIKICVKK